MGLPLSGFRVGVTATRKVDEQLSLLQRRGAEVYWAPSLALKPQLMDEASLRAATEGVLARPIDIFLGTTGVGIQAWFDAARKWGWQTKLRDAIRDSEIIARGPKSVGVLRGFGLQEVWTPQSESFAEVLNHLRDRDLRGKRIVIQEHGQSLAMAAHALRHLGAEVTTVSIYRVVTPTDPAPLFSLIEEITKRRLDAVTFTSAPAISALIEAAENTGKREALIAALQSDVLATCVGPVTAAEFDRWGVPTVVPERSRLGAMIKQLEHELPSRRGGTALDLANGAQLLLHGDEVLLDGIAVELSAAPAALLRELAAEPGSVVARRTLLASLPTGTASSEHAVEVAVARLRKALGKTSVQTVIKRGYRLAVG